MVNSKEAKELSSRSTLVIIYVRKIRSLDAALPWLYLKSFSTEEVGEALKVPVGHEAQGLSASTVPPMPQKLMGE